MEKWITYICGAIFVIGLTLTVRSKLREARENRRGWRLDLDPWGIRYEEKNPEGIWSSILIRATFRGHGFGEAHVPADEVWDARFPAWARGRREEIVSRMQSERPHLPFVTEDPNQLPVPMAPSGRHGTS